MTTNPFTFGSMLTDPNKFVGRRAELALIIARLNGSQPQGSAIVGPRRIEKSSLLYYLAHSQSNQQPHLDDELGVIYLSAAAGNCSTPEEFRLTMVRYLFNILGDNFYFIINQLITNTSVYLNYITNNNQSCSWANARELLEKLPFHPVICLDEFEALLLNDAFDDRFFNALRNWANEGLVSWVTSSAKPLQYILEDNNLTSPFFNLLATVPLGELADSEANELLKQVDTTSHAFTDSEKRIVKRLAGNHPYHLQVVAWRLWEMKEAKQTVEEQALRDYLCQQPEPPAICTQASNRFKLYVASLSLIVLAVILSWFILTLSNPFGWENIAQIGSLAAFMALSIFLILMVAWMRWEGAEMRRN